jgi:hypothetical protein
MMGNTVLWKPASSAVYSAYFIAKLLKEAGLPDGVINFVPGPGRHVGDPVLEKPGLAGVHFTGSTSVFQGMWKTIGSNIMNYRTYPRIVGECRGCGHGLGARSVRVSGTEVFSSQSSLHPVKSLAFHQRKIGRRDKDDQNGRYK